MADLTESVQSIYPTARLTLFGSSANGFGFGESDLDICLTFDGEDNDILAKTPKTAVETLAKVRPKCNKLFFYNNFIFCRIRKVKK
jgi:terminal uridylyltransferase